MLKVMIVTNSLTGGGAERSMNLIANELMNQDFEVGLVTLNEGVQDLIKPKCQVMPINRPWRGGLIDTVLAFLKFNYVVVKWKPDFLILNCELPELFGSLSIFPKNFIVVEHTSLPWNSRKNLGIMVRKILAVRGAKWLAVSSHLNAWPKKNIFIDVIPNPVAQEVRKHQIQGHVSLRRIVYIGRLSLEKRPDWLLRIAREIPIPIEIIGEGILRKQLESTSIDENLSIHFYGQQLRPWDFIQDGDLLVIPSQYEGDGLVLIEAMAYRCPVLVADIPDLRRFNLPEVNYFLNLQDIIKKIDLFKKNLEELIVPQAVCDAELATRSIQKIGGAWARLLKNLSNSPNLN